MKQIGKYAILLAAGFALGFAFQSIVGVTFRKARNRVFLAESAATLADLRGRVAAFKKARGRFPSGPAELGLDPANPPLETLRREARWVPAFDGEGGFLYLSPTGGLFLNVDLSREKFTQADWQRLKVGGLLPEGALY